MARTNAGSVQRLLGDDYGAQESGTLPDLSGFIDTACLIVSRVAACARQRNPAATLSDAELEMMERWLSAHFYVQSDQNYASKSTGGASGQFQGQTGMHLEGSKYGIAALDVDFSGCLTALSKRQVARAFWLGKPPSEQIPVEQRD